MVVLEKLLLFSIVLNELAFTTLSQPNQKKLRELPIDCNNWETIRLNNLHYIDKTPHLKKLVQNCDFKYGILTRPPGFGKTLFLQMMKSFFEGKEELFKGLSIEHDGNNFCFFNKHKVTSNSKKWLKFPVILVDFVNIGNFQTFEEFLHNYNTYILVPYAKQYNITYESEQYLSVSYIIIRIHQITKMRVVVLVDEYDSLVYNKNHTLAKDLLTFTELFLAQLKSCATLIGMVLVTGVSRLTLETLESGANLVHLTYKPELATAFGITYNELKNDMHPYLKEFAESTGKTILEAEKAILHWYNGYNFNIEHPSNESKVLNPFSTIKCLSNKRLQSYWMKNSSMKFVAEEFYEKHPLLRKEQFINPSYISMDRVFQTLNPLKGIYLPCYMLSHGYLTITNYDYERRTIMLKYPNKETETLITDQIISYVPSRKCNLDECHKENKQLFDAMQHGNTMKTIHILRDYVFRDLLAPSNGKAAHNETIRRFHFTFAASGIEYKEGITFHNDSQPKQDKGNIDLLTLNLPINYAISVQCGTEGTALNAIMQLLKYIRENPKSFNNALKAEKVNITKVYFLSLSFAYENGGELKDWIAVNYNGLNCTIDLNTVEADSEDLKKKFKLKYTILSHIRRT